MTDKDPQLTPEQEREVDALLDGGVMNAYMARAAVLGIRLEDMRTTDEPSLAEKPRVTQRKPKPAGRRYHPVSKVPDGDSASDPHWNVKRPKRTIEELAEQDVIDTFGRAQVLGALDAAEKARREAAETPKTATPEELAARHEAVVSDWDKVQKPIDDDLIAHPEKDYIFDPPPDPRFFDPHNRKPTRD